MPSDSSARRLTGVRLIAVFKLAKAIVLLVLAIATVTLSDGDVRDVIRASAVQLHLDPDGRLVQRVVERLADLGPRRLHAVAAGLFFYAGLLGVEGAGLLLGKRWAEFFTVFATTSLVPLEIYEIVRRLTAVRVAALVVNVVIVWYLIARLRRDSHPGYYR